MNIIQMDPCVPFELGRERAETIDRQVGEAIQARVEVDSDVFVNKAASLSKEINAEIAEIAKEMAKNGDEKDEGKKAEHLERMAYQESRRRTPEQLSDEERERLKTDAVKVLKGFHDKKMAGRLAQWQTTCRLNGCKKQPRTAKVPTTSGHKVHRRNFVFCPGHSGVRKQISGRDYQRLKNDANLRVIAE